ncbi:xanthine dehydrogenase family protein molybdopterin-binding subunit [Teichococcus cervicalis]|uniref:Aldehyde oxidase and xanthine dehydrogenase, molybdopterin binding domain protein n=1 Tax=Pseudoroseomonas cervicalis ATCC 49957 TaxID=525371 RepID=D5RQG9_9PROT|nr:xanthine dehydrogenase family protein molybdopterin-binding subunit [Pseudoroseomonas cervicalis]EFH10447.1 aldehyde oxidase and xanthine dehydrogenase, molybdopterin binding domain protein [Pseudoroseomonas cervicalis ATCC 49957]
MNAIIGTPVPRVDGRAKVTGSAAYALDHGYTGMLHAALVLSPVARGRVLSIDSAALQREPGIRLVLTHETMPRLQPDASMMEGGHAHSGFRPLEGDEIRYHGQIVAMVVADGREQAEEAAARLHIRYRAKDGATGLMPTGAEAEQQVGELDVGDADAAWSAAETRIEASYEEPPQHHNPIELYGTLAAWDGEGGVEVHVPSQWAGGMQAAIAKPFGLPMEKVRVRSAYVGGAFGGKATLLASSLLTIAAARMLGRPVKLQVSRQQGFSNSSFRPQARQHIRLGATREGRLTSLHYRTENQTSRLDDAAFPGGEILARLYDIPAMQMREGIVRTDVNTPGFMRAPAETPAMFAFESAIDEMAAALRIDPVELRRRNEPARDPVGGKPWSSRSLLRCYERGAELFGWSRRDHAPRSMRADDDLLGWGCATSVYPTFISTSSARLRITAEGRAEVSCAAADIGTGTYTILAQIAADRLGLAPDQVTVRLGDSALTPTNVAGGSTTALATGNAVGQAAEAARAELFAALCQAEGPFQGETPDRLRLEGGQVVSGNKRQSLAEAVGSLPRGHVEALSQWAHPEMPSKQARKLWRAGSPQMGPDMESFTALAFGAQFVEVRINPRTGVLRVPRMVAVFAGGTILNPQTAHSQLMGGMIWGLSNALREKSEMDERHAAWANADMAEYHIAVNADVHETQVEMLEEQDDKIGPIGAKGLGEIGITGVAPAIANAVFHATGRRLRRLPIRVEDLIG